MTNSITQYQGIFRNLFAGILLMIVAMAFMPAQPAEAASLPSVLNLAYQEDRIFLEKNNHIDWNTNTCFGGFRQIDGVKRCMGLALKYKDNGVSATKICNMKGYNTATVRLKDTGTWSSPADNTIAYWNGSAWKTQRGDVGGNRHINTIQCSDPMSAPTPTPTVTPTPTPTVTPTPTPTVGQCADGIDNENDGLTDISDPDCHEGNDLNKPYVPTNNEDTDNSQTPGQCADGKDNDNDGLVDINDPDCHEDDDITKPYEPGNDEDTDNSDTVNACADGKDNDGDGLIDINDADCHEDKDLSKPYEPANDEDTKQTKTVSQCADGKDNDGDGLIDINDADCHEGRDINKPYRAGNSENVKQSAKVAGKVAGAQTPVSVPVSAKTGAAGLATLFSTLAGGSGLTYIIRKK